MDFTLVRTSETTENHVGWDLGAFLPRRFPDAPAGPSVRELCMQQRQWCSKCSPRPSASTSPGSMLEMSILGPHPRPVHQKPWHGALKSLLKPALQAILMHAPYWEPLLLIGKHSIPKLICLYVCLHTGLEIEGRDHLFLYPHYIYIMCACMCVLKSGITQCILL